MSLVLRDVHVPPSPPWWPPAPGWWIVAAVAVVLFVATSAYRRQRARRHAAIAAVFDDGIRVAPTLTARLAAASELLRRAARRTRPDADRLEGDAWLAHLDSKRTHFSDGPGRLLLDGPYRPTVPADEADAAIDLARDRFVELMERRR